MSLLSHNALANLKLAEHTGCTANTHTRARALAG